MVHTQTAQRGYTLIAVLFMLTLLLGAMAVLIASTRASSLVTGDIARRQEAFYACDGVSRALVTTLKDYATKDPTPSAAEMRTYLCEILGPCASGNELQSVMDGFRITSFTVAPVGSSMPGMIPSGPFEGMNAQLQTMKASFRAKSDHEQSCAMTETFTVGQIALFQFAAFAETSMDIVNCAPIELRGPSHVNGEFCGGCGNTNAKLERLTASGNIHTVANCSRYGPGNKGSQIPHFWSGSSWMNMATNRDATYSNWRDYAQSRWNGNVQDRAHGVPNLRVPFQMAPPVQASVASDGTTVFNNGDSMRFFIDPPESGESDDVKKERLAFKSDIRIIDGVWFIKEDGYSWPGRAIWSDHPGNHTSASILHNGNDSDYLPTGLAIGREDIATAEGWGTNETPRLYSFYETARGTLPSDVSNTGLLLEGRGGSANEHQGVISYGSLHRRTATQQDVWYNEGNDTFQDTTRAVPIWEPGFFYDPANTQIFGCGTSISGGSSIYSGSSYGSRPPSSTQTGLIPVRSMSAPSCARTPGGAQPFAAAYLAATRGGFEDFRTRTRRRGDPGHVLPMNFDVATFIAALNTCPSGGHELGNYFPGTCAGSGRVFNGIVWLGSRWPEQMTGRSGGTRPPAWTSQHAGNRLTASSVPNNTGNWLPEVTHRALPFPLCGTGTNPLGRANASAVGFTIPTCPSAQADPSVAHPNAVRVINARYIRPSALPDGLSVGTNIPIYTLGNVNAFSLRNSTLNTSFSGGNEWVPMLVAGDSVNVQSEHWQDRLAYWSTAGETTANETFSGDTIYRYTGGSYRNRKAHDTLFVSSAFFGDVEPTRVGHAGGVINWLRFSEDWLRPRPAPNNIRPRLRVYGSLVHGFRSVYANAQFSGYQDVYAPPVRRYNFDPNLRFVSNQPPGAPLFTVSAVRRWSED